MAESAKWYVAHTYSGYENAVKTTIEKFVAHRNLQDLILDIQIPIYLSDHTEHVNVEVQLRTVAMDFWASLEHDLRYKSQKDIPPHICQEMWDAAQAISAIDLQMQSIYKEIQSLPDKQEKE